MVRYSLFPILLVAFFQIGTAQTFTSYFTGNQTNISTNPTGGFCLAGGATENNESMKWFLQHADGGDVVVLRSSGGNGYNDYLYTNLGVSVNSVETIVFHEAAASYEPAVLASIAGAEAIWIAGGDQWEYITYWRGTPVDSLINEGISTRNVVLGGTSAGMAIQGGLYFSAENGTVTSQEALVNPYHPNVTVERTAFLDNSILENVVTDTHYDNPNREGRHVAFMARALVDYGVPVRGIACDEYTAVCIEPSGLATIFGEYPTYDDNAYFLQRNCEFVNNVPEVCSPNAPLTWNQFEVALTVYAVKGTTDGTQTFDMNDWKTASGGTWEWWAVQGGNLVKSEGEAPNCGSVSTQTVAERVNIHVLPNPTSDYLWIQHDISEKKLCYTLFDALGKVVSEGEMRDEPIAVGHFPKGAYWLKVDAERGRYAMKQIFILR